MISDLSNYGLDSFEEFSQVSRGLIVAPLKERLRNVADEPGRAHLSNCHVTITLPRDEAT